MVSCWADFGAGGLGLSSLRSQSTAIEANKKDFIGGTIILERTLSVINRIETHILTKELSLTKRSLPDSEHGLRKSLSY